MLHLLGFSHLSPSPNQGSQISLWISRSNLFDSLFGGARIRRISASLATANLLELLLLLLLVLLLLLLLVLLTLLPKIIYILHISKGINIKLPMDTHTTKRYYAQFITMTLMTQMSHNDSILRNSRSFFWNSLGNFHFKESSLSPFIWS